MKLEDRIYNVEYYVKKFNSWDVKEIIIDDQKAFWEIRKPGSQIQKVSLFRDGSNMYIYGDYGSYSFDKMTWLGSPYNLEYNNLGYQNKRCPMIPKIMCTCLMMRQLQKILLTGLKKWQLIVMIIMNRR